MPVPKLFQSNMTLPAIAAPMFLASGTKLVIETCKAGMAGTFPALNQRTSEGFEAWLIEIDEALKNHEEKTKQKPAPFGVNLIVHKSNPRLQADLELCVKHKVPFIITSLGAAKEVVEAVHSYGGLVFHDVVNSRFSRKAIAAGVDGLICVTGGAGGHAGTLNPFALIAEIRSFYDGTLILAGCISTGKDIATAQMMGADLAYMGTRFINTHEALVNDDYKQMVIDSKAEDIIYTPKVSGIHASFMRESLVRAGIDPEDKRPKETIDYGNDLSVDAPEEAQSKEKKPGAWSDIWSAGQGVSAIDEVLSTQQLVAQLRTEYIEAAAEFSRSSQQFL
jgi:nitronate monooxygenase